jgi:hypothetical protein
MDDDGGTACAHVGHRRASRRRLAQWNHAPFQPTPPVPKGPADQVPAGAGRTGSGACPFRLCPQGECSRRRVDGPSHPSVQCCEGVCLPRMRAADPTGHSASGGLAGGFAAGQGSGGYRPQALAQQVLAVTDLPLSVRRSGRLLRRICAVTFQSICSARATMMPAGPRR